MKTVYIELFPDVQTDYHMRESANSLDLTMEFSQFTGMTNEWKISGEESNIEVFLKESGYCDIDGEFSEEFCKEVMTNA